MDRKTYERTREKSFIGHKVKSLIPLSNGLYKFPAGITWTIERKSGGFQLLSDPCPRCGIQCLIRQVLPGDVELLTGGMLNQINPRTLRPRWNWDRSPFDEALDMLDDQGKAILRSRADEIRDKAEEQLGPNGVPRAAFLVAVVNQIRGGEEQAKRG